MRKPYKVRDRGRAVFLLDREEFERWFRTAKKSLESAEGDAERGDYNWACFKSHQAAELSVKALLHGLGLHAYGHSVARLLREASSRGLSVPGELVDCARELDKLYIPTRYPNAWAEGAPFEYYTAGDAAKAISASKRILEWVEDTWRSLEGELRRGGE
ncbi:MAG: HEPN domain-containing protein [Thermofilum sp.]